MKRYTRKKVGGGENPSDFKKFDVVHVFKNKEHTGSYEMAVLFSRKHRDGTFTVQFEDGTQGDPHSTDLVLVNRFHRTRKQIENIHKKVIRYILLVDKTLNYNRKNRIHRYPKKQLSDLKEKLGPEYDGKIRFALFSGRPLNENVANLIACNKNYGHVGKCPFSPEYDDISSPVSEDDIINHYNDAAPARAAPAASGAQRARADLARFSRRLRLPWRALRRAGGELLRWREGAPGPGADRLGQAQPAAAR